MYSGKKGDQYISYQKLATTKKLKTLCSRYALISTKPVCYFIKYLNTNSLTLCASILDTLAGHLVIEGKLKGTKIKIIVDLGAQANFVNTAFGKWYLLDSTLFFRRAVVNIKDNILVLAQESQYSNITFKIEGFQTSELVIIGVPNILYDAVLEMPWLRLTNASIN